jgi:hypothetical protein
MNIGNLYKVKKWSWLLFPTKEKASEAAAGACTDATATAQRAAPWYSKRYNCEVTYFSLDSYIVFLEKDGALKKVLTSDGLVGWTWFVESYNDCFEEVKTE